MPQFQYTAVNNSGKKLTGIIGATTEKDARKQLNTLGISVLEMSEKSMAKESASPHTTDLNTFEFEAIDKRGRKVVGTIPAMNRSRAFFRLMEEYDFEVNAIMPANASESEKAQAKSEDLSILKAEYQAYLQTKEADPESDMQEDLGTSVSSSDEKFQRKRIALIKKVDMILEKIRNMLKKYEQELNPENKKVIQSYVDKLLRIKSSTNLDYIEHTSEELLKKVQDQELFLHQEKMALEKKRVNLETERLMAELHTDAAKFHSMAGDIGKLGTELSSKTNPLLSGVGAWLKSFAPSEEIRAIQEQIHSLNYEIRNLRKLWITAESGVKEDAKEQLRVANEKKAALKAQILELKNKTRAAEKAKNQSLEEPIMLDEIKLFIGALLSFYLLAYFASHYMWTKAVPGGNLLPGNFDLLNSPLLGSLLISLFLWYGLLNLRLKDFRYTKNANLIILPLGALTNLFLLLNL